MAIEGTVIRVPKARLIVQPHTKPDAGMRTIAPPSWVMAILLGHDRISMTQDEYVDRHVAGERVPDVLTEIAPESTP